jgi:hypothetical protein
MLAFEPFWMFMETVQPTDIRIEAKLTNDDFPPRGIKVMTKESEL